jgi:hypothetical protein
VLAASRASIAAPMETASVPSADNRIENQFARFHHAAAEHYALDVQQVDDGGDRRAYVFAGALNHQERKVVAVSGFACDIGSGEVVA